MTPQELKNSILQLAIQGKLVEQRSEEGTAEELYQQIQVEKQKIVEAGVLKGRKTKGLAEITDGDTPYEVPQSWKWIRLGDVVEIFGRIGFRGYTKNDIVDKGNGAITISPSNILPNGRTEFNDCTYISWAKYEESPEIMISEGDIIMVKTGSSYGKCGIVADLPQKATINPQLAVLKYVLCDVSYLNFSLKSPMARIQYEQFVIGTSIPTFSQEKLANMKIPLPPHAEQKRIVAKIEELLPYIDRYEKAWSKLEDFNKRFPTDMQKSILQTAIQGKLVEQRPEDGTGEELYQQIQAEKQRLIKAGSIKKEKPLPEIAEDEKPFDIPESWKWVRLNSICKSIADGDHQAPPQVPSGVPFIVISNLSSGVIDFSNTRYVPQEYFDNLSPERVAENGDLIFTVTGSYGIAVKVDCVDRFCFQRHMALLKTLMDNEYLFYLLKSPLVKEQCDDVATGTAQKTVGLNSLRNIIIPFPPLAEQKRIVTKLEEILPLCEKLKK